MESETLDPNELESGQRVTVVVKTVYQDSSSDPYRDVMTISKVVKKAVEENNGDTEDTWIIVYFEHGHEEYGVSTRRAVYEDESDENPEYQKARMSDGKIDYWKKFGTEQGLDLYPPEHESDKPAEQVEGRGTHQSSSTNSDSQQHSTFQYQQVVEIPNEKIPPAEAVESPPRCQNLSQEAVTIVEEIGTGGQAVIHKAHLPKAQHLPTTVALREPDTSATMTKEAVEKFLSQAETWETVDSRERNKQLWEDYEHTVGIVATGDRQPWLAIEYMDAGDLEDLLAEHINGLPVGQALWYGECICKALEIAHSLGRVHLDVKPGNVLLKETDGWPWPKLADWGLARTLAEETGTIKALSVEYASPEQFDSDEFGDPDQLTDIYQTGALVYALLTGEPPATGSQFEVMQQVMSEETILPPSDRRPELPPAVDAAVEIALEREKTDRYSSISAFANALNALRTGGPLPQAVAARLEGPLQPESQVEQMNDESSSPLPVDRNPHNDLVKIIKSAPSCEWAVHFFDLAAELIDITGVAKDDDQLVMSIRTDQKSLPISLGNRYCLKGYLKDEKLGVILPHGSAAVDELQEKGISTGQFSGGDNPPHWYSFSAPSADDVALGGYHEDWQRAVEAERERGYRRVRGDAHEPAVYRAATDTNYRQRLLNDAGFDSFSNQ